MNIIKLIKSAIPSILFVVVLAGSIYSQNSNDKNNTVVNKFANITVSKFSIDKGVEFPEATLDVMMAEIVDEMKHLKKFSDVSYVAQTDPKLTENTTGRIRMVGRITKYDRGSRAARYLIGFGAGTTKVVAMISFEDASTGALLFEKQIDGKVVIGLFGGDSTGATRAFARSVAKVAKSKFFK